MYFEARRVGFTPRSVCRPSDKGIRLLTIAQTRGKEHRLLLFGNMNTEIILSESLQLLLAPSIFARVRETPSYLKKM